MAGLVHLSVDDDSCDQAVNTKHTSHDNWDDGAHDHVRTHDAHRGDANSRLCCSVRCAKVCKHHRRGDAHEAEEDRRRVTEGWHGGDTGKVTYSKSRFGALE